MFVGNAFICTIISIKLKYNFILCLASCVIIEMNVEQHNTVENVRERCEGRGNTNAPLKPHDGHQLVRLFETSEDYEGEKDLDTPAQMETLNAWDKCCSAAVQHFHLSSIYKLKATSDSILITNKVVRFVIKEEFSGRPTPKKCQSLPGLAEQKIPSSVRMETSVAKRGLKESRGEPKDTDIQRVPDREKTGNMCLQLIFIKLKLSSLIDNTLMHLFKHFFIWSTLKQ